MSQRVCKTCFSTDIETNDIKGEVICLRCGTVLEENKIVESLEFVENSNGGVSMVGQFIPNNGSKSYIVSLGIRDNREVALQKGYANIQKIADNLHLSNQLVEAAQRLYLIALQRNFTMGRNNSHVAASCLYTICRREKSPIMLIDFSDVLQTPVKPLGKTFIKLLRLLHMTVPNIDPSLFLERFAHKLNLKSDIPKVTQTGIKLIQAMTRDWISTGRRPTGLCGAALLISTRIHGISINSNVIADIVRISNPTLIKRLSEFKNTQAAQLTTTEFEQMSIEDIPANNIPPCVKYSEERKKRKKNETESVSSSDMKLADQKSEDILSIANCSFDKSFSSEIGEKEIKNSQKQMENLGCIEVEEICNENPKGNDIDNLAMKIIKTIETEKANSNLLKNVDTSLILGTGKMGKKTEEHPSEISYSKSTSLGTESNKSFLETNSVFSSANSENPNCVTEKGIQSDKSQNITEKEEANKTDPSKNNQNVEDTSYSETLKEAFSNDINDLLNQMILYDSEQPQSSNKSVDQEDKNKANSSTESKKNDMNISNALIDYDYFFENNNNSTIGKHSVCSVNSEDELSTVSHDEELSDNYDSEIENMILSEKERERKMLIWDDMMKSYLPHFCKQLKSKKRNNMKQGEKKAKKKKKEPEYPPALTAQDSVLYALEKTNKNLPSKINYDVLKSLFS